MGDLHFVVAVLHNIHPQRGFDRHQNIYQMGWLGTKKKMDETANERMWVAM